MVTIDLDEKERGLLLDILEREISSVRSEVYHADRHEYRDSLKETEQQLKDLQVKLKG